MPDEDFRTPDNSDGEADAPEVKYSVVAGRRYPQFPLKPEFNPTPEKYKRSYGEYEIYIGAQQAGVIHPLVQQCITGGWDKYALIDKMYAVPMLAKEESIVGSDGKPVLTFRVFIDKEFRFYLAWNANGDPGTLYHSGLPLNQSDRDALFSGEFGFDSKGLLCFVSNGSGHYHPSSEAFNILFDWIAVNLHPSQLATEIIKQVPVLGNEYAHERILAADIFARNAEGLDQLRAPAVEKVTVTRGTKQSSVSVGVANTMLFKRSRTAAAADGSPCKKGRAEGTPLPGVAASQS